eukprot:8230310-Karenia_brevis.AAC.1
MTRKKPRGGPVARLTIIIKIIIEVIIVIFPPRCPGHDVECEAMWRSCCTVHQCIHQDHHQGHHHYPSATVPRARCGVC